MSYTTVTNNDYWDSWFDTYNEFIGRLKNKKNSEYWERWFEVYSSKLNLLKTTEKVTK